MDEGERSSSHHDFFTSCRNSIKYPLNRRLGGPYSQSPHFGKSENLLQLPQTDEQFNQLYR
jgi:hypothetical protein